ncbi:hypothetical protein EBU24_02445, partial [bacterium]|nr:hypothetical protein [bacterium]
PVFNLDFNESDDDVFLENKKEEQDPEKILLEKYETYGWKIISLRPHYILVERNGKKSFSLRLPALSKASCLNEPDCYLQSGYFHDKDLHNKFYYGAHTASDHSKTFIDLIYNDMLIHLGHNITPYSHNKYLEKLSDEELSQRYNHELFKIQRYKEACNYCIPRIKDGAPTSHQIKQLQALIHTYEINASKRPNPFLAEKYHNEIEIREIKKQMTAINAEYDRQNSETRYLREEFRSMMNILLEDEEFDEDEIWS